MRKFAGIAVLSGAVIFAACDAQPTGQPYCGGGYPAASPLAGLELPSALGMFREADVFSACEERSPLAVVRIDGAWAGTSQWHATNDATLPEDLRNQTIWFSFLVGDADNAPPTAADAVAWKGKDPLLRDVAADSAWNFRRLVPDGQALPIYVLVDRRTLAIVDRVSNPAPEILENRLRGALAKLAGEAPPAAVSSQLVDGTFTKDQWGLLQAMTKPSKAPPDPTNAYGDDGPASALGRQVFFDTSFSPSNTISCETCHKPADGFGDARPHSIGVGITNRNSPSIITSAHSRWMFLDGRRDSLWSQALGPFEDANEYNSSRLFVVRRIAAAYADTYARIFPQYPLPDLSDISRFPMTGKPGDPAWEAMAPADQDAITRAFVNIGKSIAAYERTLRPATDAFDRYVAGERSALNGSQKEGLKKFFDLGCAQCHYGQRLTDDAFHVIRMATGRSDHAPDRGRIDGLPLFEASAYSRNGKWSDSPGQQLPKFSVAPTMLGAFKTPTLRGVAATAPYGHGGEVSTLRDAVVLIGQRGLAADDPRAVGATEPWVVPYDATEGEPVLTFLSTFRASAEWW